MEFSSPLATIIMPAHQEEAVLGHTLTSLLAGAAPGEFEIIVIANGCSDRTAEIAAAFPDVHVIELAAGDKIGALNAGRRRARPRLPRIFMDADIEITPSALRALAHAVEGDGARAAIGRMDADLSESAWAVRQYYRVWRLSPYFDRGKFGGVYALSAAADQRLGELPPFINDDEWVSRQFMPSEVIFVPAVRFIARAPLGLADLVAVRSRVYRGNRELDRLAVRRHNDHRLRFLARILLRPHLWPAFAVFLHVMRRASQMGRAAASGTWERDESSRQFRTGRA